MYRLLRNLVIFDLLGVAGFIGANPDTELIWAFKNIAPFPAALLGILIP